MSTRVVDQVDSWDEQSFSGGYAELQSLADSEFSGVVRAGSAELYMTKGVAVGLRMGDIEDFDGASGSAYEAPTDALPLLAIMQERSEEVRAKYYTEETSISKVDKTLSDGGFTGFIELSENVLSGDYYLVYHAGTSMSVAYVGEAGKLLHGDEAFETADDEVGIYKVRPVDIEPVDIPEPPGATGDSGGVGAEGSSSAGDEPTAGDSPDEANSATGDSLDEAGSTTGGSPDGAESAPGNSPDGAGSGTPAATSDTGSASAETGTRDDPSSARGTETTAAETKSEGGPDSQPSDTGATPPAARAEEEAAASSGEPARGEKSTTERKKRRSPEGTQTESTQQPAKEGRSSSRESEQSPNAGVPSDDGSQSSRGKRSTPPKSGRATSTTSPRRSSQATSQDLETKAIPSIDPNRTAVPDNKSVDSPRRPSNANTSHSQHGNTTQQPEKSGSSRGGSQPPGTTSQSQGQLSANPDARQSGGQTTGDTATPDPDALDELEEELEKKESEIDRLDSELERTATEREELETELDEIRTERDELREEVDRLEQELTRLEEELGAATDAERRMTGGEALAGTDIFVRYRSKGKATLEKAHGSSTRKDEVTENLRLEKHTQFDASSVAVGGKSYDEFLEGTLEYQFVRWVVQDLLFEIRDTGHEKELRDLYDALPRVDRAELSGVIDVTYTEDGQETQSQETFDVVLRDRMGTPLLAANLNASREATTESMMERLITSAERVGRATDEFSGAFLVTESFFDPGALEVASESTQGGLLSRDKRKSFVNLSRKQGYHLCLVEARSENFTLAVPEL